MDIHKGLLETVKKMNGTKSNWSLQPYQYTATNTILYVNQIRMLVVDYLRGPP